MKLRADILLFGALAIAAVAGGWWLLANRPGAAIETFQRDFARSKEDARPRSPPAEAFRARICADAPCVVVEAGGLTFVFGAGNGAAQGITRIGLMHANIDAVLLPDLAIESVEGLAAIAKASADAGRQDPLKVFGPAGLLAVVDGSNLIASATLQAKLAAGIEGEDEGQYGRLVFDSGVVTVRGFGGSERGTARVYRVDFDGRSLILAGCTAGSVDIVAAAREVKAPGVVAIAGSERLLGAPAACTEVATLVKQLAQLKLPASVVIPGDPPGRGEAAGAAWRQVLSDLGASTAHVGEKGTVLDLTGSEPRILLTR